MTSLFTGMVGVAPRPAETTFFKPNLTLNPIKGGFITAEGMHFFSMFYTFKRFCNKSFFI